MSDDPADGRAPRIRTQLPARLIDSHGTEISVTIIDLSATGFRLLSIEPLEQGEEVRLLSGKGESQPARIMWTRDNEAGGLFLLPLETQR
jgi:hypothetical protein